MANKVVKFLGETYGKQSLLESLKAGGWKGALDGNLAESIFIHGPGATLKGVDGFGNKYYERKTENYGRHRWVIYGNLNWPDGQDPSTIPAEWHGWINHITDVTPQESDIKPPVYAISAKKFKTGTEEAYLPKGAWKQPNKRNWTKIQTWQPPRSSFEHDNDFESTQLIALRYDTAVASFNPTRDDLRSLPSSSGNNSSLLRLA